MTGLPATMQAVLLLGHGGPEMLEVRSDVPTPSPAEHEVLIRVGAAGVNNTDINTRIGWYSKSVTSDTSSGAIDGFSSVADGDGGWTGSLDLPRIQGADVAGEIVATGSAVEPDRLGQRVIVRPMQDAPEGSGIVTLGSEMDGGFAQYCVVRSSEAFTVVSDLSDIELATFPCAFSTAEGMLARAKVGAGDRVVITGASGGVGSAAIQLAKRRGADVVAVASASKWDELAVLGPTKLIDRNDDLVERLGPDSIDVVIDVVAGPTWPDLLEVLRPHGRYVVSGAIAGPIVELDVRTLYLKDLSLLGSTQQPRHVFDDLVRYIENGEIVPVVAASYPLDAIAAAQERFQAKDFVGNIALVPREL